MNIPTLYSVASGLSGKTFLKKSVLIFFTVFYLVTLLYIFLFDIEWLNQTTPFEILYGGYRQTDVASYSSTVSFLFIIMIFHILYYVNTHAENFFNTTTIKLLHTGRVSSLVVFSAFFLKTFFKVFLINIVYVAPLIILYAIRDGVFVSSLLYNFHFLYYSSVSIILIYNILFFFTKKPNSGFWLSILLILLFSLISFKIPLILEDMIPSVAPNHLHYLIPDIISIPYQYILKSFGTTYSAAILYYSMVPATILFIINFYLGKSFISRLAISSN